MKDSVESASRRWPRIIGLLLFAAALGLLIGPPLIADMRLSPAMAESLRASVAATAGETTNQLSQVPGFGAWITSLVPANAMKSAADGAMLPLIVFTVFFALAARRIDARLRQSLIDVFSAIAGATRAIVDWVIIAAPIGVFALVLAMARARRYLARERDGVLRPRVLGGRGAVRAAHVSGGGASRGEFRCRDSRARCFRRRPSP